MSYRQLVASVLIFVVGTGLSPARAQRAVNDPDTVRTRAAALGRGTFVVVLMTDGSRVRGTLLEVTRDALRVQPRTRIPSPPVQLALTDIESLEPGRAGMSAGKRVVIIMGIGAAVAAVIGLFAYAAAAG